MQKFLFSRCPFAHWTLLVCLLFFFNMGRAQELERDTLSIPPPLKNAFFVELLGSNLTYTIGYSRTLLTRPHYDLMASIGISTNFSFKKPYFAFGFPITVNNRFKFWEIHGVDLGVNLGNFLNVWTIKDKDQYFTPDGQWNPPVRWMPSVHVGWAFNLYDLSISPRFYGIFQTEGKQVSLSPYFGVRLGVKF